MTDFFCSPRRIEQIRSEALRAGLRIKRPPMDRVHVRSGNATYTMQTENDYEKEVYNGDLGFVTAIDPEVGEVLIAFDEREVTYSAGELDQVVLAYATTIHKSQGSEYPVVVIPVMTQHYAMLQRNLLYTCITRGKRLVVLIGQKKAVIIAVKNVSGRRRWSKLRDWLT